MAENGTMKGGLNNIGHAPHSKGNEQKHDVDTPPDTSLPRGQLVCNARERGAASIDP